MATKVHDRPAHGADGRCPNCKMVLQNTSEEFATCPNGDMRLVPAFPPAFLARAASDLPTATRLTGRLFGHYFTYQIDGHQGVWRRQKTGAIVAWEQYVTPIRRSERWKQRRFTQVAETE